MYPHNYRILESVEGSYFATSYCPNANTIIEYDGCIVSGDTAVYGTRSAMNVAQFSMQYISTNTYRGAYGTKQLAIPASYAINTRYLFRQEKNRYYVNGTLIGSSTDTANLNTQCPLYLMGALNTGNTVSNTGTGRLYSCRIWESELLHHFIPCIDSQNRIGLYDIVTDEFILPSGTGVTSGREITRFTVDPPTKRVYYLGEQLDLTGFAVSIAYDGGTPVDVTADCTISGTFDPDSLGEQIFTIDYGNAKGSFSVTVQEEPEEQPEDFFVGMGVTSFRDAGLYKPISRVTLYVDHSKVLTAGDDSALELVADCPHATQDMLDSLLERLDGYQYQAFSADSANVDPAAELGDCVSVCGVYGVLSQLHDNGYGYPDISAPGEAELEDEYPAPGPMRQEFDRELARTRSIIYKTSEEILLKVYNEFEGKFAQIDIQLESIEITVSDINSSVATIRIEADSIRQTVEAIDGRVGQIELTAEEFRTLISDIEGNMSTINQTINSITMQITDVEGNVATINLTLDELRTLISNVDGRASEIEQKVDSIRLSVSDPVVSETGAYVELELTIGGNTHTGIIHMVGNVDISGQLSAEALYAAYGSVANLEVDRLKTSRRIPKYLAGDTSDDQYINIQGQQLRFISGAYAGGEEQAVDPNGNLLYWEQDISEASIGSDGYPYINSLRVYTTTQETEWPVMVYTYSETDKIAIEFDPYGINEPLFTLGAGWGKENDPDAGKGFIQKRNEGLEMWLHCSDGEERGIGIFNEFVRLLGDVYSGPLYAPILSSGNAIIEDVLVNRLSTSKKIIRYLAHDTSDDQYVDIQGNHIRFVEAAYANGEEQATDIMGNPLYWERDISSADIGSDGYPYIDGNRVLFTSTPTEWPVMVYTYTELDKINAGFDEYGVNEALIELGAGWGDENDPEAGKAFIRKENNNVRMMMHCSDGEDRGIIIYDDHVEIPGLDVLPKVFTVDLPATGWSDNSQTVSAPGVIADSFAQAVTAEPAPYSYIEACKALVYCSDQGDGTLTFECEETPEYDLTFNIMIQRVEYNDIQSNTVHA